MSERNIYNDWVLMDIFCYRIVSGFLNYCEEKGIPISGERFGRFLDEFTAELDFKYEECLRERAGEVEE